MRVREIILNVVMVITAICAIITVIYVVRGQSRSPAVLASQPVNLAPAAWRPLLLSGHRIGPVDAKLTIIEFGDFQCPVCGEFEQTLDSMRAQHPADFAVIFHHFPLRGHPLAYPLARASECAADQGQFTAFHDTVYADQDLLGVVPVLELGVRSGIRDTATFHKCILNTAKVPVIDNDAATARRIGVRGTPGVIVDGVLRTGVLQLADLERAFQHASH